MLDPNSRNDSSAAFFALTALLSLPFYVLNALAYLKIVGAPEMGALYIALFTVAPIASASILTFRESGRRGLTELLGRIFDFKRVKNSRWFAAVLLAPLLHLLSLAVLCVSGLPIPPALTPLVALPAVLLFFFLLAAGEEVGWMGYTFAAMQERGGALREALVLGLVWALWHVPFLVFMMPDPVALGAQALSLVGARVLMAWIFNNTGHSVFAVILFHAADNTALVTLPEIWAIPQWGAIVHCGLVILAAGVVITLWGPRTLASFRPPAAARIG